VHYACLYFIHWNRVNNIFNLNFSTGIDENHIDECSDLKKCSRNLKPTSKLIDDNQEQMAQIQQAKFLSASSAQEQVEPDISAIQGFHGAHEKSRVATSSNCSDNTTLLAAVSFPKLGKKADSLSVKELKTELGKRGQPIDGNKKGDFLSLLTPSTGLRLESFPSTVRFEPLTRTSIDFYRTHWSYP
jgi:hypothetical protein